MGTPRTQQRHCQNETVTHLFLRHIQDICDQHVNNVIDDCIGRGVLSVTVAPTAAGTGVTVSNLLGVSGGGYFKQTGSEDVDLTSYFPITGGRWISIFATPSWNSFDLRPNGVNVNDYHQRIEDFTLSVVAGASSIPSHPSATAVRICSVWLYAGSTIIPGNIKYTRAYADLLYPLSDKLNMSGGVVNGPIYYNTVAGATGGRPMVFSNSGSLNMGPAGVINSPSYPDYHGLFAVAKTVNSFMAYNNLHVNVSFDMEFIDPATQGVSDYWIQPSHLRFHSDLGSNQISQGILVSYERNAQKNKTGWFTIIVFGTSAFVGRFANNNAHWLAIASPSTSTL